MAIKFNMAENDWLRGITILFFLAIIFPTILYPVLNALFTALFVGVIFAITIFVIFMFLGGKDGI